MFKSRKHSDRENIIPLLSNHFANHNFKKSQIIHQSRRDVIIFKLTNYFVIKTNMQIMIVIIINKILIYKCHISHKENKLAVIKKITTLRHVVKLFAEKSKMFFHSNIGSACNLWSHFAKIIVFVIIKNWDWFRSWLIYY